MLHWRCTEAACQISRSQLCRVHKVFASTVMEGCCSFPVEKGVLSSLVEQGKDYLTSHGLVLRTVERPADPDLVTHAPVTLFPSPVPRKLYQLAQDVQNDINLLMHRIAHDREFLQQCLGKVIEVDDFTGRLWNIYEIINKEGVSQPYSLGMNRSDYMFDYDTSTSGSITKVDVSKTKLRQIEVNTMASSFGGLCQQTEGFHKFVLSRAKKQSAVKQVPENPGNRVLGEGLVKAWEMYRNPEAVLLFLVQKDERNLYDQRFLEYAAYEINPGVQVIRKTMAELTERAKLSPDKALLIDGYEVAVVYQRALYTPSEYSGEADWDTRLLIERSRAIKCPSAAYHLAGTKKVQQVLTKDGVMERFVGEEAAQRIRSTFAAQYSLDLDSEGDEAALMANTDPHKYVLKPQREGGGNNTFGDDIPKLLSEIGRTTERNAYILMELVHPASVSNYMLRSGQPVDLFTCISEIGVFGAYVGTKDQIILNRSGGHILRTKAVGTNEGGVATGFSCLDSPYLVD